MLPISRHYEKDAGRYIGSGILVCKDPDTGVRNLSYQRLQLKAPTVSAPACIPAVTSGSTCSAAQARRQNLEVAIVIGVHPAINLAAGAKVAMEVDEFDVAGALIGQPVDLVKCQHHRRRSAGGGRVSCSRARSSPTFTKTKGRTANTPAIRPTARPATCSSSRRSPRRRNPIFHDIIPGYSAEHLLLGRSAKEAHVYMRLKEMVPNLKALNFPKSGTHFHAYLSMKKTAEGQPRHALMLLLGLDPYLKFVVAVDEDVDVFDEEEVLWAMATRFQADTDMFMVPDVFCNRLDPSSRDGMSAKLALDATAPLTWDVERAVVTKDAAAWAAQILARN